MHEPWRCRAIGLKDYLLPCMLGSVSSWRSLQSQRSSVQSLALPSWLQSLTHHVLTLLTIVISRNNRLGGVKDGYDWKWLWTWSYCTRTQRQLLLCDHTSVDTSHGNMFIKPDSEKCSYRGTLMSQFAGMKHLPAWKWNLKWYKNVKKKRWYAGT